MSEWLPHFVNLKENSRGTPYPSYSYKIVTLRMNIGGAGSYDMTTTEESVNPSTGDKICQSGSGAKPLCDRRHRTHALQICQANGKA